MLLSVKVTYSADIFVGLLYVPTRSRPTSSAHSFSSMIQPVESEVYRLLLSLVWQSLAFDLKECWLFTGKAVIKAFRKEFTQLTKNIFQPSIHDRRFSQFAPFG